jgi:hypothetical protein
VFFVPYQLPKDLQKLNEMFADVHPISIFKEKK